MRHKLWLLAFLAFWLFSSAIAQSEQKSDSAAQRHSRKGIPAPQWALDRFKLCWDALKEDSLPDKVYQMCWRDLLQTGNIAPFKDELQEWAMNGVQPGQPAMLRYHSLQLLCIFQNDTTQQALRSLISHRDSLQVLAAQTLIKWGDWDHAAPVLEERGLYKDLAVDSRAMSVLYRTLRSPDLERRLAAAEVLYGKLDKPDSLHYVVRQVLNMPSAVRNNTVTKLAVDMIAKSASQADLKALAQVVNTDTSHWAKLGAFGAITTKAFLGDSIALAELQTIGQNCPDADIRSRANGYVKAVRVRARAAATSDSLSATDTTKQKQP